MLLVATLPLGATALLVYSGGGTPFYNIFHLVAFAILLEAALRWLAPSVGSRWARLSKSKTSAGESVDTAPTPS